jgi:hypothetical protein
MADQAAVGRFADGLDPVVHPAGAGISLSWAGDIVINLGA